MNMGWLMMAWQGGFLEAPNAIRWWKRNENLLLVTLFSLEYGFGDSMFWGWSWVCAKLLQSCLTLCDPVDCSPPGSSVHGILQRRIIEWVACPPPGDLPNPGIEPASLMSRALTGWFFTTGANWEALFLRGGGCSSKCILNFVLWQSCKRVSLSHCKQNHLEIKEYKFATEMKAHIWQKTHYAQALLSFCLKVACKDMPSNSENDLLFRSDRIVFLQDMFNMDLT